AGTDRQHTDHGAIDGAEVNVQEQPAAEAVGPEGTWEQFNKALGRAVSADTDQAKFGGDHGFEIARTHWFKEGTIGPEGTLEKFNRALGRASVLRNTDARHPFDSGFERAENETQQQISPQIAFENVEVGVGLMEGAFEAIGPEGTWEAFNRALGRQVVSRDTTC